MPSRSTAALHAALALVLAFGVALSPAARANAPASRATGGSSAEQVAKSSLPPLPADRTVRESVRLGSRTLNYTVTVGSLPVRDADGRKIADVVFMAYEIDGPHSPRRPVTFVFNGGPGASSAFLNLGAIGPKRIQFGTQRNAPSDPPVVRDNPGTWLDFTDLVFIDPVGTGYSRSLLPPAQTDKTFYTVKGDVAYLSRIVYDWLVENGRLTAPKYMVGESYGGFRAPAISYRLQTQTGVGVSGVIMISPYAGAHADYGFPLSWAVTLPSMAAAQYEREHEALTPALMSGVEDYARTDYVFDLLRGIRDRAAVERIVTRVAAYTGLDPVEVRRLGGRIDVSAYVRMRDRDEGLIGSAYDANVTRFDPFPTAPEQRTGDPILMSVIAPLTSAMVNFLTRDVGWQVDAHYETLSFDVTRRWEPHWPDEVDTFADLRQALALDPRLEALIVHGYTDLTCPYFRSALLLAQIPQMGAEERLQLRVYPGGHMFYARPQSLLAFKKDAQALYDEGSTK